MDRVLVWDLPVRVFHLALAACCAGALAIALLSEEDSPLFRFHMLLGLAACFLLLVRLVLGVIGSRHNRLRALLFSPRETVRYGWGVFTGRADRYFIHNPGTAAVAVAILFLIPLLLVSGIEPTRRVFGELHGVLAYALLALVLGHLAGLVIHTIRYRENLALAMLSGRKQAPPEAALESAHPVAGALVLLACLGWIGGLFLNYAPDRGTVTIPLLGSSLSLGEGEGREEGRHEREGRHEGRHDRDDD